MFVFFKKNHILTSLVKIYFTQKLTNQFCKIATSEKALKNRSRITLYHSWAKWQNPPKIRLGNSWNWQIILVPATVWQFLNIWCPKRTSREFAESCLEKFVKSHQVNFFLRRVLAVWNQCVYWQTELFWHTFNVI